MDDHAATSEQALLSFDRYLDAAGVRKDLIAIKTNAITEGEQYASQATPKEVGRRTVELWRGAIDDRVKLVLMLSGGLSDRTSTEYLNAIALENTRNNTGFDVSSSFGRAAHRRPVEIWSKDPLRNVSWAQDSFAINAVQNELARQGNYSSPDDPR